MGKPLAALTVTQERMLLNVDWNEFLEGWLLTAAYSHQQVRERLRARRLIESRPGGYFVLSRRGERAVIRLLRERVEQLESQLEHEVRQHG